MVLNGVALTIVGCIYLGLTVVMAWALIDAILRPAQAYHAASKQTKATWLWILGLALAADVLLSQSPFSIFTLVGTVAAFVYLLDVKPALAELSRRR